MFSTFQIVSMRNDVKRSKVHTINNMTRQAKKLRIKNGTEEQKSKNIKKAERLIQEIMVIKVSFCINLLDPQLCEI